MKTRYVTFRRPNYATITLRCHVAMLPTLHGQRRGLTTNAQLNMPHCTVERSLTYLIWFYSRDIDKRCRNTLFFWALRTRAFACTTNARLHSMKTTDELLTDHSIQTDCAPENILEHRDQPPAHTGTPSSAAYRGKFSTECLHDLRPYVWKSICIGTITLKADFH